MVTNKVAMSSTLAVYELSYPDRPPLEDRVLDALAPEAREEYLERAQGDRRRAPRSRRCRSCSDARRRSSGRS